MSFKNNSIQLHSNKQYENILHELPDIIQSVVELYETTVEPTIEEKSRVYDAINDFIREKQRKVYGGTAVHYILESKKEPGIYTKFNRADVEFYSNTPLQDLIELCDVLHKKGFNEVQGKEAEHDGTYHIFVNYHVYCDISYAPTLIYHKIRVVSNEEDPLNVFKGIQYVHPHFMLIDWLRIYVNPIGAAERRWEKVFKRMHRVLKFFPFDVFNSEIELTEPDKNTTNLINKIRTNVLSSEPMNNEVLLMGLSSYNFLIGQCQSILSKKYNGKISKLNIPYLEVISTNYTDTVIKIYEFIKSNVEDKNLLSIKEYNPFFQFLGYSTEIYYGNNLIIKIFKSENMCIPYIETSQGYKYVSFMHHLMMLLIMKFRYFVENNKSMYHTYGALISNTLIARSEFYKANNIKNTDESPFSEFRVDCIGKQMSDKRSCFMRKKQRKEEGKIQMFMYCPTVFDNKTEEEKNLFKSKVFKYQFPNLSGNIIKSDKKKFFSISEDMEIGLNKRETSTEEEQNEEIDINISNDNISIDLTNSDSSSE